MVRVRQTSGGYYHLANGILTVRLIQPLNDRTGTPNWPTSPPVDPVAAFERDGMRIPRYDWHSELVISVTCTPSTTDSNFCAGPAVSTEPVACASGWSQTAYDRCCGGSGGGCVDADGMAVATG